MSKQLNALRDTANKRQEAANSAERIAKTLLTEYAFSFRVLASQLTELLLELKHFVSNWPRSSDTNARRSSFPRT